MGKRWPTGRQVCVGGRWKSHASTETFVVKAAVRILKTKHPPGKGREQSNGARIILLLQNSRSSFAKPKILLHALQAMNVQSEAECANFRPAACKRE
jgi:hypothetical protein